MARIKLQRLQRELWPMRGKEAGTRNSGVRVGSLARPVLTPDHFERWGRSTKNSWRVRAIGERMWRRKAAELV